MQKLSVANQIRKIIRFGLIYGFTRAMVKAIARKKIKLSIPNLFLKRNISFIGCGQFAFSTIAYFLYVSKKGYFFGCYDIDPKKSKSLKKFYGFKELYDLEKDVFNANCKIIYIASNHASHTDYAIKALAHGIDVFIEKPICTSLQQFKDLMHAIELSENKVYVGYNRPFSKAIMYLDKFISNKNSPITLSCFISGHLINLEHWYRKPEEGTRVCGNLGHWIDLSIHLMAQRGFIPMEYRIKIAVADIKEPDDNISISIITDKNDIINIILTSRSEPFEGINETINLCCGDVIAKIDDFRKIVIWQGANLTKKHFWPKDVGHKLSILQPFIKQKRDFEEIKYSTLLMLIIKDMVTSGTFDRKIDLKLEMERILNEANNTRP